MNASQRWRRSVLILALACATAGVYAQTATEFKPTVGQPGKDVVWVPSPQALVDKMLDLANVTAQDYVIDLGSGDGRTVITAAKRGATALGIEYNPDMVALSQKNAKEAGVTNKATFVKADIFESDFSKATVITMFLLPDLNLKLRPKILDLKPGTRIVSNTFTMGDWEPEETFNVGNDCLSWCTALFWIVPAKVQGSWKMPAGQLNLTQKYQMVTGTLNNMPISEGRLRGDQIQFTAGGMKYTGRVNGNVIEGTAPNSWRATRG
jgi:SAM-dependent methyltransferase